jgi:hypothetical protein
MLGAIAPPAVVATPRPEIQEVMGAPPVPLHKLMGKIAMPKLKKP